jgi:AhpD family alkylhydroperoxidase
MGMMGSRYDEIFSSFAKISQLSPNELEAWQHFMAMAEGRGAIDPKNKELIAVALSVCAKCDWCIALSVKKALQLGARKREIIEAAWVAVLMSGGPALMHAQRILQALEEFKEIEGEETSEVGASPRMEELDSESKKLYRHLLDYVRCVCDEVENMCDRKPDRLSLALKIAESDGRVLKSLVVKECDQRGWDGSS